MSAFAGFAVASSDSESEEEVEQVKKVEPVKVEEPVKKKKNKKRKKKSKQEEEKEEPLDEDDAFLESIVKENKIENSKFASMGIFDYQKSVLKLDRHSFNYKKELKSLFAKAVNQKGATKVGNLQEEAKEAAQQPNSCACKAALKCIQDTCPSTLPSFSSSYQMPYRWN